MRLRQLRWQWRLRRPGGCLGRIRTIHSQAPLPAPQKFLIRRCHLILSNLRAPGGSGYVIPRGFLFDYITCANYTAEIWSWVRCGLCLWLSILDLRNNCS